MKYSRSQVDDLRELLYIQEIGGTVTTISSGHWSERSTVPSSLSRDLEVSIRRMEAGIQRLKSQQGSQSEHKHVLDDRRRRSRSDSQRRNQREHPNAKGEKQ